MFETLVAALARLRVALGWVFGLLVIVLANPSRRSLLVGMSVAVVGEAIRVWAAGHLNKAREVTSSGPYRFVGHPLYLGSSVMGFGLAIAIFLDALVIRCVLLPAVLELLGPTTWKLPRWIDERLPHINIEGSAARESAAAEAPQLDEEPEREVMPVGQ